MADHLPYKAEYAKSDRSSCQLCKSKIGKETLRLAAVVKVILFTNGYCKIVINLS